MLTAIFDLFTQIDDSLDRSRGGLGIGLTLVRRLVELHGGRIHAHSAGLGTGSEFVVELPRQPDPVEASPRAGSADRLVDRPTRRVLVVDDNLDAARMLAALLRAQGHSVETAHDGASAIEAAVRFRPDVALLDIGLPRLSGYEVATQLRGIPETRHIRLIALTGYGKDEDRDRALRHGFDHHLVKPVDHRLLDHLLTQSEVLRSTHA